MSKIAKYEDTYNKKKEINNLLSQKYSTFIFLENLFFYSFIQGSVIFLILTSVLTFFYPNSILFMFFSFSLLAPVLLLLIGFIDSVKKGIGKEFIRFYCFLFLFKFDITFDFKETDWYFKYKDEAKNINTYWSGVSFINKKKAIEEKLQHQKKNEIEKLERSLKQLENEILDDELLTLDVFNESAKKDAKEAILVLSENIKQIHFENAKKRMVEKEMTLKFKNSIIVS